MQNVMWSFFGGVLLIGFVVFLWKQQKKRHRAKLLATPAPPEWRSILQKNMPLIDRLSAKQQKKLFSLMQVFLDEKIFEGCGGLELSEEIKITIAAQACLLLLGQEGAVYPRLKTILVYPHTYSGGQKGIFGGDNGASARLGESWGSGVVVLAWNSVLGGAQNIHDGHNVTFHEFAHQLDQEDGAADGVPVLKKRSAYASWAHVFNHDYKMLIDETEHGKKEVLNRYGATDPAEFFAVATETFFEKPHQLKAKHPELFEELKFYYALDPMDWLTD